MFQQLNIPENLHSHEQKLPM